MLWRRSRTSARSSASPFETAHLHDDLGGRTVRGGSITMVSQGVKFALQTVSTVLLARLLVPEDFGLFAMVMVAVAFGSLFKDLGLSWATVQRSHITHEQVSTLFWINVAIAVLLTAVTAAVSPVVAAVYGDGRLTAVTIAMAGTFLLHGLGAQHLALLRRQMRYGYIAAIEVGGMAAGVVAGIASALMGSGYWALVVLQITSAVATTTLCWFFSGWLPGPPRRHAGIREMISFGSHLTGFSFLNYFTRQADKALLGYFIGSTALGYYTKAYNLFQMPMRQVNAPLTAVALPVLSRLQGDHEEFRRVYLQAVKVLTYATAPAIAFLAATAQDLVPLVLGDQWYPAARVFQFLALAGVITPLLWTAGWVQQSLGRADRMLRWSVLSDPFYVLSFVVGLRWGAEGVALAFAMAILVLWIPTMAYAFHGTSISLASYIGAAGRPLLLSAAVGITALIVSNAIDLSSAMSLAAAGGVTAVVVLLIIFAVPVVRHDVGYFARLAQDVRGTRVRDRAGDLHD